MQEWPNLAVSKADSQLRRKYVVDGIDRFQTGKYAGNHSTGFMVGYLATGCAAAAVTGTNRGIANKEIKAYEKARADLQRASELATEQGNPELAQAAQRLLDKLPPAVSED